MAGTALQKTTLETAVQGMVSRILAAALDESEVTSVFNTLFAGRIADAAAVDAGVATDKVMSVAQSKRKIDEAVAALVNSAPAALDTINELAAALNNDPNIIQNLTTLIGQKETPAGAQAKVDTLAATVASTYATKAEVTAEVTDLYTTLTSMFDGAAQ